MEFGDDSIPSLDKYFYHEFYATDTSCEKSFDLDAFFGYDKPKKNTDIQFEEIEFKRNRIFVNRLDSFNGKYISLFLSKRMYGDVRSEDTDEEGEGGEEEEDVPVREEGEAEGEDEKQEGDKKEQPLTSKSSTMGVAEIETQFESLREYEFIDALYAKYDVSKLTVFEYGELLNLKTHEERLIYLEKKFGVLKKDLMVENSTNTENIVEKKKKGKASPVNYEIVGTLKSRVDVEMAHIQEIITYDKKNVSDFISRLMKCGIFILDITIDPLEVEFAGFVLNAIVERLTALEESNAEESASSDVKVVFILISTLMTWANTKPIDPEQPELAFTEKDFKKRRSHPNYKSHLQLEKDVFAAGLKLKRKLKVMVIGTAGIYGYEQKLLHYLFQSAWLNEEELPVFGRGKNMVPLINVDDLAMLLHMVISNFPKSKYVFAIEKPVSTLKEIAKAVSKALGTGKVRKVAKQDALVFPDMTQAFYDVLVSNFNVESNVLEEEVNMMWKSELGFVDNIKAIAKQFKACRNLKPVKILIVGPPGVGKTSIAIKLSDFYKINYLNLHRAVDTYVNDFKNRIKAIETRATEKLRKEEEKKLRGERQAEEGEGEEEQEEEEDADVDEEEEDEEQKLASLKEKLKEVQQRLEDGEGQLDDEYAVKIMKDRLLSLSCQNQGYVLDGYPTTLKQPRALFGINSEEGGDAEDNDNDEKGEEEAEGEESESVKVNKRTIPDIVICLEANDDHIFQTLLTNPHVIQNNVSEQDIYRNITKYRKVNTEDNTLLIFFDELELYPHVLNVEGDKTIGLDKTTEAILSLVGSACNYEAVKMQEAKKKMTEDAAARFHEMRLRKHKEIRKLRREAIKRKLEMWATEVDRMKEEEEEVLAKECMPLRSYLVKFVLPTLTNGLIEVAKVQPDDPVDYLAEYLFKENPEGRMFLEDREEPSEIKKMINMLFEFKSYLQATTHYDDAGQFLGTDKPTS